MYYWWVGDESAAEGHLHKCNKTPLITLVSLHSEWWGHHSGPGLAWLGPDYATHFLLPPVPSLPPAFPFCCHWHTHITTPRTWFNWKYCWGGREAVTIRVNRSCLQLDWLKLILKQHPQNPKRLFLIVSLKMCRESATPFNCIGVAKSYEWESKEIALSETLSCNLVHCRHNKIIF